MHLLFPLMNNCILRNFLVLIALVAARLTVVAPLSTCPPRSVLQPASLSQPLCPAQNMSIPTDEGDKDVPAVAPRYAQALAGAGGGLATVLLLHPLDTLKTRLQSDDAVRRTGAIRVLRGVVLREGFRALYSGAVPAVVGGVTSWAFYMQWFHGVRHGVAVAVGGEGAKTGAVSDFISATSAGIVTAAATNPIWVVKVRLQLQRQHVRDAAVAASAVATAAAGEVAAGGNGASAASSSASAVAKAAAARTTPYTGFLHGLVSIAREEGVRGLYKGLVPSLWLVSHGAIQFAVYERLKVLLAPAPSASPSVQVSLIASTTSKLSAAIITYPLQLVRTRMQEAGASRLRYGTLLRGFGVVMREDGFRGLYRGLGANLVRVLPQTAVTFVTYEQILRICRATISQPRGNEEEGSAKVG